MNNSLKSSCPICGSTGNQKTILARFNGEDFGHMYCTQCGATYDSNIWEIRATITDQDLIEQIDNRDDYRRLFVETWDIAKNDDDEVYPDFDWDDNQELQAGVLAPAMRSIADHHDGSPQIKILDLGCGNGFTTKLLGDKFGSDTVIGLDPSPSIKRASLRKGFKGLQGTLHSVRFADNQFDAVVIIGNIMLHSDILETLSEARRVTRAGGIIIFDFKNVRSAIRVFTRNLALVSKYIAKNSLVQRNFLNMRYGLNRSHLKHIAPSEQFELLESYSKPPRLLAFANKSSFTHGVKGILWKLFDIPDRLNDERAWLHVTLRVKK